MSIRRTSLEISDIELDRYYPPTDQEKVNQIGLDYDFLRGADNLDYKIAGLKELARATMRAANMLQDSDSACNIYIDASERANSLVHESEAMQSIMGF